MAHEPPDRLIDGTLPALGASMRRDRARHLVARPDRASGPRRCDGRRGPFLASHALAADAKGPQRGRDGQGVPADISNGRRGRPLPAADDEVDLRERLAFAVWFRGLRWAVTVAFHGVRSRLLKVTLSADPNVCGVDRVLDPLRSCLIWTRALEPNMEEDGRNAKCVDSCGLVNVHTEDEGPRRRAMTDKKQKRVPRTCEKDVRRARVTLPSQTAAVNVPWTRTRRC
ncbi:uncharacterized protein LAESUDRAFT_763210 [Laetiporus sulphureus 93-53]|uniref:Uncharacterized protein n=1 Tax=Laetiporus sulphureus 93-53 TaxID=1314785 RepID=A0A165BZH0_9APHY|nr:uncharacterized protein LAESUDRAFT_763210 [Laetiporus sulphureus 93-53]KZT01932.1 hypothetical protein LAESUDRAFT_763210 [Laetiporus sulphureus 93-53]